jgi:ATP-dependent helicase HrpB
MSDLAGDALGGLVGYHVRLERKSSRATRVLVLTEGLLSRRILSDPELSDAGLVVFDEFHERSLHADFGLALALDVQHSLRPDLRILVMSATLDAGAVARHLGGAPAVRAEGRMFPVETSFLAFPQEPRIGAKTALGVRRALAEHDGSVLAFLPGEGEIRACAEILSAPHALPPDVDLRPLYAALPRAEQDAALRPSPPGRRKVVLATSIAESSLTIEGVSSVVDSGWARISRFSADTGMSHLETVRITRDRADQRRGRAGRLGPGFCYRLWDEGEDRRLAPTAPPEILVADLAPAALACADWGSAAPDAVPWPTPPPAATWRGALALLRDLRALDAEGRITPHGRDLARIGAHPRLAHMMLAAGGGPALREACLLAAALSENLPASARPSSNAEHLVRDLVEGDGAVPPAARARIKELAKAWEKQIFAMFEGPHGGPFAVSKAAPPPFKDPQCGSFGSLNAAEGGFERAQGALGTPAKTASNAADGGFKQINAPSTGVLLSFAYPDRLARRRKTARDEGRYLTVGGRGAKLAPGDGLARHEWIVIADIDDADADGAVRLAAPIAAEDVERLFGDRTETERVLEWNARAERVDAVEREKIGAIPLRERPLRDPDPEEVLACLCRGVRAAGIERLGWTDAARALQARAAFARRHAPDEDIPDLSDDALAAELESWLGPRLYGMQTLAQAAGGDLHDALLARLGPAAAHRLDVLAPTHLVVATGSRIRIDYSGDEPTASVRLQECFGMSSTPRIAGGRVSVRLQLLSPAHRPVQVTSDLASFWREGYPLVRKELRGRYPRHVWPEDPATAQATRRAKPRAGGFTLVEVVVASAVAVLLAVAVAGVLGVAFGSFGRVASDRRAEEAIERIDFFEAIRSDLVSAMPEPGSFEGDALSFRLLRLAAPPGAAGAHAETVRWEPASGAARRIAERAGTPAAEAFHPFAPRFSYARLVPPVATNAPAALDWLDDWRRPGLPAAVRVVSAAGTWELPVPCFDPASREEGGAP